MSWFKRKKWTFDTRIIEGIDDKDIYDIYYHTRPNGIREYKKVLVITATSSFNQNSKITRSK